MDNIFNDFFPIGLKSMETDDPAWKEEINKWLVCVRDIDQKYFDRAKTRVKRDVREQESLLAELRSIYFFKEKNRCNISALEPDQIDFSFTDNTGVKWCAEVKCPSYTREINERDLSPEDKIKRMQQPKNVSEIFSFDFSSCYADAIRNTVKKFKVGENNLLIISSDRFVPLIFDPFFEENIILKLKQEDPLKKISAVILLDVFGRLADNFETRIEYNFRLFTTLSKYSTILVKE
jgi:hypothetical protein